MGIFLYHTTDLLWFVLWYWTWRCLHLIGHHHFLLHFSSLVIQNYFPTMLPSLHHVWSKVEAHLQSSEYSSGDTFLQASEENTATVFLMNHPPAPGYQPTSVPITTSVRVPCSKRKETTLQPLPSVQQPTCSTALKALQHPYMPCGI